MGRRPGRLDRPAALVRRPPPGGPVRARRDPRHVAPPRGRPRRRHAGRALGLLRRRAGDLFAAEHHPRHASELRTVGAAAGGGGVDITSSPEMFEVGNVLSGIPFGACIAASQTFPDFELAGHLTPHGRALVESADDDGPARAVVPVVVMLRAIPTVLRFLAGRFATAH